jgi:hypothetical protein
VAAGQAVWRARTGRARQEDRCHDPARTERQPQRRPGPRSTITASPTRPPAPQGGPARHTHRCHCRGCNRGVAQARFSLALYACRPRPHQTPAPDEASSSASHALASMVGDTGFEPLTSSVSRIPRPSVDVLGRPTEHEPFPPSPSAYASTRPRCQAVSQAASSLKAAIGRWPIAKKSHFAGSQPACVLRGAAPSLRRDRPRSVRGDCAAARQRSCVGQHQGRCGGAAPVFVSAVHLTPSVRYPGGDTAASAGLDGSESVHLVLCCGVERCVVV